MSDVDVSNIKSRVIQPPTGENRKEYLPLLSGQTVCTVKDAKGQNCSGHVKQWYTADKEALSKAAPGNTLHRCQRCYAVYEGPPQEYLHPQPAKK